MPEQIDDNTVTQAKAGDRAAIAAVYEYYQRKIHRFFYYRTLYLYLSSLSLSLSIVAGAF